MGYQLRSIISCSDIAKNHDLDLIGKDHFVSNISSLNNIENGSLCFFTDQLSDEKFKNLNLSKYKSITVLAN